MIKISDEQKLVMGLQQGKQAAYRDLVDTYQGRVFNTCLGFVYNTEDAEDLCQEVFFEVFRSIGKFNGDAKLSTWIYRISVTKSLELIRRRNRKKRAGKLMSILGMHENGVQLAGDPYDHPGVQLENKERAAVLFRAIESLPENQRTAFSLNKLDGRPYAEVAEIMGLSLSAIESLIFRARRNLRDKLKDFYRNGG